MVKIVKESIMNFIFLQIAMFRAFCGCYSCKLFGHFEYDFMQEDDTELSCFIVSPNDQVGIICFAV
jgi:hypothetical protein